jgi:hypothetical protein
MRINERSWLFDSCPSLFSQVRRKCLSRSLWSVQSTARFLMIMTPFAIGRPREFTQ